MVHFRIKPPKTVLLAAAAIALAWITACTPRAGLPTEARGKLVIVSTILPLADWAQAIGGDHVYVQTLLPAGASPHTFDPSPRDMRLISHAKILLKVGLQMDDWGAGLARSAGKKGPQILSLGEELQKNGKLPDVGHIDSEAELIGASTTDADHSHDHNHDHGDHHDHDHSGVNPHFWLDPNLAIQSVQIIKSALIKADPAHQSEYEKNAAAYIDQLTSLDAELAGELAPFHGKSFVSFHNAWPYFAQRYDLKIAAVIEEYPGKSPGEKYLREVTDRLKTLGIKTIFSEPQLNPRVAEVLASEIGANVKILDPYGTPGVEDRNTYIKVMRYNAAQLKQAFVK